MSSQPKPEEQDKLRDIARIFVTKPKRTPTLGELIIDAYDAFNSLDEIETKSKHLHWWDFLVISRQSVLFKAWTIIFMLVCILSSFFYAFQAAFRTDVEKPAPVSMFNPSYGEQMSNGDMDAQWLFRFNMAMIIIESFSAVDFIINFHVEFTMKDTSVVVRELYKTALNYI